MMGGGNMAKYRKKPILVGAQPARYTQFIATLEGISTANPGDMICEGVENEQWVVKPEWFFDSYEHVHGDIWRRKPQILTAVQITEREVSPAPTGDIVGSVGDWRITGKSGEHWYVKPDIFDKTYTALTNTKE
jgi:hypothetical protein